MDSDPLLMSELNRQCRVLRISNLKAFQPGHFTEPMIRCHKNGRVTPSHQPDRHGQLQRVKRSQASIDSMSKQQTPRDLEMIVADCRHQDVTPSQVGFKSSPRNPSPFAVNLACSDFRRKCRLHFHDRETRNQALRTGVGKKPLDEIAALLSAVVLCEGARIEE